MRDSPINSLVLVKYPAYGSQADEHQRSVSDRSASSSRSRGSELRLKPSLPVRSGRGDLYFRSNLPEDSQLFWPNFDSGLGRSVLSPQPSYLLQSKPVFLSEDNMQVRRLVQKHKNAASTFWSISYLLIRNLLSFEPKGPYYIGEPKVKDVSVEMLEY